MRKAYITTIHKQISRFLRMNLEGLMLELRWEKDYNQRAFLAREIAFNLALQLHFVQGVIPGPGAKLARAMYQRLTTQIPTAQPGDTVYLTALASKGILRWATSRCRYLKVEARRGRVRIGVCVWLDSRDWEPVVRHVGSRQIANVSLVLPVVTTLRAGEVLASLAKGKSLCERQHG